MCLYLYFMCFIVNIFYGLIFFIYFFILDFFNFLIKLFIIFLFLLIKNVVGRGFILYVFNICEFLFIKIGKDSLYCLVNCFIVIFVFVMLIVRILIFCFLYDVYCFFIVGIFCL